MSGCGCGWRLRWRLDTGRADLPDPKCASRLGCLRGHPFPGHDGQSRPVKGREDPGTLRGALHVADPDTGRHLGHEHDLRAVVTPPAAHDGVGQADLMSLVLGQRTGVDRIVEEVVERLAREQTQGSGDRGEACARLFETGC